jgi:hypothetical protein
MGGSDAPSDRVLGKWFHRRISVFFSASNLFNPDSDSRRFKKTMMAQGMQAVLIGLQRETNSDMHVSSFVISVAEFN